MIDPRAVVDAGAELADDVEVGPFSVIGPEVVIGPGTVVGPHVVIKGPTRIGRDNRIYQFASVGEDPQDKKYGGERTYLEIGDRNTIREYATIHRGTAQDQGLTRIGNDVLLMAYTHVAHDCQIDDHVILSNAASLGGHVWVGDWAILSGFAMVHQFCHIGAHAFLAMGSAVSKDVPPYVLVSGQPAEPYGINTEGLKRRGFGETALQNIKRAYRVLYKSGLKLEEAQVRIAAMADDADELRLFTAFFADCRRSIVR
ncbi:MAG: acyl-ACP--UDP-N-acetylglucosamine O-acyltransferase [Gammaproteobacteria bacterium]|nr:acyl-ACP--UDP-N-acetylglucosamine O-acyltransferase [Gammaproteobacteria bacterium]MBU1656091.1 acyl-ACP--UDP-N-acetylglucosamine O-acyltransferase [Gammaproteobacteria bacterium]MBU1962176.1 acyl-ACP--UDP-N-acetylglucosamine O-acyltransferase [Gammaproteobacteria bacterium]